MDKYRPLKELIAEAIDNWDNEIKNPQPKEQVQDTLEQKQLLSLNDIKSCYDSPKGSPLFLKFYSELYDMVKRRNATTQPY